MLAGIDVVEARKVDSDSDDSDTANSSVDLDNEADQIANDDGGDCGDGGE